VTWHAGSPEGRREAAVSYLSGVLGGVGATMLGPILPMLSRTWSLNDADAGTLLACEFVGGFCGRGGWEHGNRS
jgi:hypothetical protein